MNYLPVVVLVGASAVLVSACEELKPAAEARPVFGEHRFALGLPAVAFGEDCSVSGLCLEDGGVCLRVSPERIASHWCSRRCTLNGDECGSAGDWECVSVSLGYEDRYCVPSVALDGGAP